MASESRSDVWNHFTKSVTAGIPYGTCNYCKNTLKCLYDSTASLCNHLKMAHAAVYYKLAETEAANRRAGSELEVVGDSVAYINSQTVNWQ